MKEIGLIALVQMAADLLNDRLPEAREAARSIVISVYEAFTESEEQKQEEWQSFCQSNLSPINAQSMVKIIPSQQSLEGRSDGGSSRTSPLKVKMENICVL